MRAKFIPGEKVSIIWTLRPRVLTS